MLRPALTVALWLVLGALRCLAAESLTGAPPLGKNFTIAQPALTLVWIAPGSLVLSATHAAGDDTHVTLTRGYWLGQTAVTQAQWQAFVPRIPVPSFHKGSDRPVESIAWGTAMEFCRTLTERERAAGRLPAGYVYPLPTEAQREYACRAGTSGIYAGDLDALAWYEVNSGGETHPVARKKPNAWGLYDMHGNVQEWCADWYAPYPGGSVSDPTGIAEGQFRVLRGGSWSSSAGHCRSAFRNWGRPSDANPFIGFRVALAFVPPGAGVAK